MDVYQCPECELRFRNASEMDAHIKADHPEFHVQWSSADDYLAWQAHRRRHEHVKRYRPSEDS
jgi:hypothetical protein